MLTEKMKSMLKWELKNFLFNGNLKACHWKACSSIIQESFTKKFYETWLYNPLLHYLEQAGLNFLWFWKISMTDHRLISPFKKSNRRFYLYTNSHIQDQSYNVTLFYSDTVCMLFILWVLEDVVKERVRSDDIVSKLTEEGGLSKRLGVQDTRRRQSA